MLSTPWRHYQTHAPEYLARHYWWAYLSKIGVWFFDQPLIINLILYGQYRQVLNTLLKRYETISATRTLQLGCAYGDISPALNCSPNTRQLHIIDIAEIQLAATRARLGTNAQLTHLVRMNAESLAYANNSIDCVIIFFLLHELPATARARALGEAMRVLSAGGTLLIAEFGENVNRHFLHRLTPWRHLLTRLEPFLNDFWHSSLDEQMRSAAKTHGKALTQIAELPLFNGFYRVVEYRV